MSTSGVVDRVLAPADRLRWFGLKALGGLARPIVVDRELRVSLFGLAAVGISFVGVCIAPFWMLALGPIIFGVGHVLSDVRYLVVRPKLHRRRGLWLAALPLLLVSAGAGAPAGFAAVLCVGLFSQGALWRKGLVVGFAALAIVLGLNTDKVDLALVHAHNFVAVGLWWLWRARARKLHFVVVLAIALAVGAIAWGVADPAVGAGSLWWGPAGLPADVHLRSLAPGVGGALGIRIVLIFAFAQAVHYGIWLRLVPEEDRPQPTPRTFRSSYRALVADFGGPALAATSILAVGVVVWALADLAAARSGYLRLAGFHAYLELGAIAFMFVERKRC